MNTINITTKKLIVIIGLGLALAANTYFYISKDDAPKKSSNQTRQRTLIYRVFYLGVTNQLTKTLLQSKPNPQPMEAT